MNEIKKLEAKFISTDNIKTKKKRNFYQESKKQSARSEEPTHSLLSLKIGICAVICLLALLLKLVDTPFSAGVLNSVKTALDSESDSEYDETLGKLKFVELPGLLTVFSGGDKLTAPVDSEKIVLEGDNVLKFTNVAGESVVVSGAGMVKTVSQDEKYGSFVVIKHQNDLETYYYGLKDITIEEGQPVRKLDTIGIVDGFGCLYFKVFDSGVPKNPENYLKISVYNNK
ncbi:MAG: M23 family metallopeptidase [Clostridia bacterium]